MRFTFATALSLLWTSSFALPTDAPINKRQDLNTPCTNFGDNWCVDGQTWTCRQITFDKGLVTNTYKKCSVKKRQDLNTQCNNLGEEWCVGGQKWTCRQITFDRGLVTNTYKDC